MDTTINGSAMAEHLEENPSSNHINKDYTARGMSAEVMQALRSHERMDELQFIQMNKSLDDIKTLVEDTKKDISLELSEVRKEMRTGFKAYDNKFWSLAIVTISLLLSITGILIYRILFPLPH